MSAITPTQPPLTPINTSQHTTQNSQALAPTEGTTASQTQNTPARGRGSRGRGCGETRGGTRSGTRRGARSGTRGGAADQQGSRTPHRSWTNDKCRDGLSTLNLIVEWLTVEGNYNLWRNDTVSKREVDEVIVKYIIENGGGKRKWEGVDQQITNLEKKFRAALAYQSQTGQGILDAADELARQAAANPDDSEAEDYVGQAVTETETAIRKICEVDDNLAAALNLGADEEGPTTPDHWSDSNRGGNRLPVNTPGQPSPGLNQTLPDPATASVRAPETPAGTGTPAVTRSASMAALAAQRPDPQSSNRRVSYAERITDRLFPSQEEMNTQAVAENQLNQSRLNAETQMVEANIQLASALREGLAPTDNTPERQRLQTRQMELDVELREVEIQRTRETLQQEKVTGAAFARAKMLQDFIRSGLPLADAVNITNQLLGPVETGVNVVDDSVDIDSVDLD
ncbi:hypothetical protein MJO28_008070 [Puccinia striiformis f. sp. tritici]|uniref:Uncharacterized protein n=1 Tax=Puccinia striiformis f. sp. tritici TaxID=168172 RepID=A0ACC0EA46_9BASI|nr:hypothetical protein MJO28_008070 [Puccinia striiformis f. sp. tritici]